MEKIKSADAAIGTQTLSRTLVRAIRGRCPKCGEGRLFIGYLKPVENCSVCGEALGKIRSDDGPAWLTILLTGHILAPALFWFSRAHLWPYWITLTAGPLLALGIALTILPRAKGFFIAMIWRTGATGANG